MITCLMKMIDYNCFGFRATSGGLELCCFAVGNTLLGHVILVLQYGKTVAARRYMTKNNYSSDAMSLTYLPRESE
jgi:hypothetical protein